MTDRGGRDEVNLQFISSILLSDDRTTAINSSELQNNSNNNATAAVSNKLKIYCNLTAITVAFSVYHAGIFPINSIQNSLNLDRTLQIASLSVHTATIVLQCLFFNPVFLKMLGLKRSVLVGLALEVAYIGTNMHPRWWTLIPAALLSGLGRPLMHTAGCIFIGNMATLYFTSYKSSGSIERVQWTFFSMYFILCTSAKVIGDIVSASIMGMGLQKYDPSEMQFKMNLSTTFHYCGINLCERRLHPSLLLTSGLYDKRTIPVKTINGLCGFSLGCLVLASLVMLLCIQSLEALAEGDQPKMNGSPPAMATTKRVTVHHLLHTILSWKNPKQALLLPLLLYNGMDQSFFVNDFTKSFVLCLLGSEVAYSTLAWFGLIAPIAIGVFSIFKRPYFHSISFLAAFGGHLGIFIALLHLNSTNYNDNALVTITVIWGIGSGLWPYCLSAFNAIVLDKHLSTAFSNYYLFNTLGASLNYAMSYYLCTEIKIYVVTAILSVGFIGYMVVEILHFFQHKK